MKILILLSFLISITISTWTDANWQEYPYMVTLFGCGGAIISLDGYNGKGVILTAAHCAHVPRIGVGCTHNHDCSGDKVYQVEQRIRHPDYAANNWIDIGVLILNRAITYPGATAVELDTDISITNDEPLRLLGYGGISRTGVVRSDANELETAMSNVDKPCLWHNDGKHICIIDNGSGDGFQSVCGGDSGSPWIRNGKVVAVTHGVLKSESCSVHSQQVGTFVPVFIQWIRSVLYQGLTFDHISTIPGDPTGEQIGWVKIFGCTEQRTWVNNWIYANGQNRMLQLAPYAITAKIVPQGRDPSDITYKHFAVYAKQCSNPVVALNNGKEMSFKIDVNTLNFAGFADVNDWYGEYNANRRLRNWCGNTIRPLKYVFFHGCGNVAEGLHVESTCLWEWDQQFGFGLDIYFGFDIGKAYSCDGQGNGDRILVCPAGTEQIGGLNADIAGCGLEWCHGRYGDKYPNIQSCADACASRADCKSISWAPMNGDVPGQSTCTLYNHANPTGTWGRQIMCKWRSNAAAKSSILNFDFINNIKGINGNNYSIFTYLMYIIGILLALNIICLTISCYKKGNKNTYKVISVESTDMDTDAENQILVK